MELVRSPSLPDVAVHQLFARQATVGPERVALHVEGRAVTYRELDERSNGVARALRVAGVAQGQRVALCIAPSLDLMAALLGVLKAGATYVPLNEELPPARLHEILADAAPAAVLTHGPCAHLLAGVATLRVDEIGADPCRLDVAIDPASLAYVIYTSGSTGRPKGVQVSHHNLANLFEAMRRRLGFGPDDAMLSVSTVAFDLSVPDLYLPLVCGGRLVLTSNEERHRPAQVAELLREHRVTVMQAGPAYWRMLLEAGWTGDPDRLQVVCGGEAFPLPLAEALRPRCRALWNAYGPTETTVWATMHRVDRADLERGFIPLGEPLDGMTVHLLDDALAPAPPGEVGELCIGGHGVAQGYLGRPELEAERFVADPFAPGARMYRTGDRARRRADGSLEYVGRTDHQIKLRGFRIELGDIEHQLERLDAVRDAAVVLRDDRPSGAYLAAYVSAVPGHTLEPAPLRNALRARLPAYMLPTAVTVLPFLPKTPNGKIDRRALPRPGAGASASFVAPERDSERFLADLWARVLDLDAVSVEDDFFLIGGDSLRLHVVAEAIRVGRNVDVSVRDLFRYPTIRMLASYLEGATLHGDTYSTPVTGMP